MKQTHVQNEIKPKIRIEKIIDEILHVGIYVDIVQYDNVQHYTTWHILEVDVLETNHTWS